MDLVFDFEADIRALYADKLRAVGVPVKSSDKADDLIVRFFSLDRRRINPASRRVEWSSELLARRESLPADYQTALARIEAACTSGGDLNPYQSRDLAKAPWKSDPQLLEWGITHFHLGLVPHPKHPNMVASTDDLLFASVRGTAVYFIDVFPHNSFSQEELFKIATRNWPDLFKHAAFSSNVVGLEYEPTADERKTLRAANINVMSIGSDGRIFGPVGGGRTTKGASVEVVRAHLLPRMGTVKAWEKLCQAEPERIVAMIPEQRRQGLSKIELRASENSAGQIEIAAVNLPSGALVIGVGRPPRST